MQACFSQALKPSSEYCFITEKKELKSTVAFQRRFILQVVLDCSSNHVNIMRIQTTKKQAVSFKLAHAYELENKRELLTFQLFSKSSLVQPVPKYYHHHKRVCATEIG